VRATKLARIKPCIRERGKKHPPPKDRGKKAAKWTRVKGLLIVEVHQKKPVVGEGGVRSGQSEGKTINILKKKTV